MRILLAHSFYRVPGGEDLYVRQVAELLGGAHAVRILETHNEELSGNLAAAHRMVGSRAERKRVQGVVDEFRPDVVHIHNVYPSLGPSVHQVARDDGIPLAMTVHNYRLRCPNGLMFTEGAPCRRCVGGNHLNAILHECFPSRGQGIGYATALWLHRFVLKLERFVDLFITPSDFVRSVLVGWRIPEEKITTIRNFTDFSGGSHPSGSRHGLYVGRLSMEKGLDVLLESLRRVDDPEFVIAGTGPHEGVLREQARALGLKRTRFLGLVDRPTVAELLDNARYLAIPSTWDENAPLAALEAMSHGVPLLVTDKGGLPELAAEGTGIICPAGDEAALAEGIGTMMRPGPHHESMSERARLYAASHFTPEVHQRSLEGAYRQLVEN